MNHYEPKYMQLLVSKLENIMNKRQKIVAVAREMSLSRQTIHKYLLRYKRYGEDGITRPVRKKRLLPAHNRTSEAVENCVVELAKTYVGDGVQTLADRLQYEYNTNLNPTTIYRILKRKNIRYTAYYEATKKRWKKQLFCHQIPGQELQMDTKYPYGYKLGRVIYTIIDDASRWAFVWSYETANADNTVNFLEKVLNRIPFEVKKIRTDQGTEFLNKKVDEMLEKHGIEHRKNTPYCPEENGKIERFHSTLNQKAFRYGFKPAEPLDDLQYKLNLFMHYYNYQKKHRGLGMDGLTPMQRLEQLKSVNLTLQYHKA